MSTAASEVERGLTAAEVARRAAAGRVNLAPASASPPVRRILARNLLSPVNLVFGAALVAVVAAGARLDALFVLPLVFNIIVGTTEELLAKRQLDRLAVVVTPRVTVRRDGAEKAVRVNEVVEGDVCLLQPGDQVVADGPLLKATGLELDESALTGESDPVPRAAGGRVESGTLAVAGSGVYRAERVGAASTAARLVAEAQRRPEAGSPIQRDLVGLLTRTVLAGAPVLAVYIGLVVTRRAGLGVQDAVRGSVAAVISLLPEGLLLLTSTRLALGVVRLARRGLVASRLDALETLARVEVLCLDKTGTITENRLTVAALAPAAGVARPELETALQAYSQAAGTPNATVRALAAAFGGGAADSSTAAGGGAAGNATRPWREVAAANKANRAPGMDGWREVAAANKANRAPGMDGWREVAAAPFSSARRWSGVVARKTDDGRTRAWILGAPELFGSAAATLAAAPAHRHRRAVAIGAADPAELQALIAAGLAPDTPPPTAHLLGVAFLDDVLRAGAADTLDYFRRQGVALKLITGDRLETAQALGARVGLAGDATTGTDIASLPRSDRPAAAVAHQIFGRVTPAQKRDIIEALQHSGGLGAPGTPGKSTTPPTAAASSPSTAPRHFRHRRVAMTGDGVNDVLALRAADLGIALQEGTAAAQAVAKLVMLRGAFAALPEAVREGRRIIEGISIGARLFMLKSFYSLTLTAAVTIVALAARLAPTYPLTSRNFSLLATFTVGIPALILAIVNRQPRPPQRRLIQNILRLTIPGGVVAGLAAAGTFYLERLHLGATLAQSRSGTTLALALAALAFIPCTELASAATKTTPPTAPRLRLAFILTAILALVLPALFGLPWLRLLYDLVPLPIGLALPALGIGLAGGLLLVMTTLLGRRHLGD